ncbi:hypothetical protein AB0C14_22215 [Microbispora hainanensis]|uniref:hypothetical protein n=1 Tax=Microbispora hainanensis TaxID=568844 RepID=UPI0033F2A62D
MQQPVAHAAGDWPSGAVSQTLSGRCRTGERSEELPDDSVLECGAVVTMRGPVTPAT